MLELEGLHFHIGMSSCVLVGIMADEILLNVLRFVAAFENQGVIVKGCWMSS